MIFFLAILPFLVQSLESEEYNEYKLVLDAGHDMTRVKLMFLQLHSDLISGWTCIQLCAEKEDKRDSPEEDVWWAPRHLAPPPEKI